MFSSVLIANRGEIACRITRTARRLGMRVIAVHSDVDQEALHVKMADEAVAIGPASVRDSYLRPDRILEAARETGAEAIHPGYGFLSENAGFAEACRSAGIAFVGPPPEAIRAMGLKDAAKALMRDAAVPVVPGYMGEEQDAAFLERMAAETGYPVLIKAVAGGGGKGMRLVADPADFRPALESCQREALSAFGDPRVLIERFVSAPRHIEIQVFGDQHGNTVHLFERDCSLQRRHQKVIEEAPAPGMTPAMREAMGRAAVLAAKAVGYQGAGTVEFIVDSSRGLTPDSFFFMEMNTRLQVEHPVTEAVTGLDLVALQFQIAAGQALPFRQEDLRLNGHAVEARLYAEDPDHEFLPQAGRLRRLSWPAGLPGLRIDTGVEQGDDITPHYDPMIAKLIFHAPTRSEALQGLATALDETVLLGIRSNRAFLTRLLRHPDFVAGAVDTGFIGRHLAELVAGGPDPRLLVAGVEAWLALVAGIRTGSAAATLHGWSLAGIERRDRLHLLINGEKTVVDVAWLAPGRRRHHIRGHAHANLEVETVRQDGGRIELVTSAGPFSGHVALSDGRILVASREGHVEIAAEDLTARDAEAFAGGASIKAPMPGKIVRILTAEGRQVARGERLVVLEAMKMEHTLSAARAARVDKVLVSEGEQVQDGKVLVTLSSDEGQA
ncbi:MAG TPA: acetyl/propionyl/methylcrotonyl-CoA carboxylase subunit alpha [Aestuariivirgaceae bacterium]|jgi:3-methylcrotonyl-CoA carboxylase alpha subunit|nr:acetyl/propionyl/methylcrotonyl-CoA carboxylase subunit alpha [Aestuariivirgaceae bacterium]